jgi:hypothetical protein
MKKPSSQSSRRLALAAAPIRAPRPPYVSTPRPLPAAAYGRAVSNLTVDGLAGAIANAEFGYTYDLFAIYRDILQDAHIQSEFAKRMLAVLGDPLNIAPQDKTNADDVRAAEACRQMVLDCENWMDGCSHLFRSVLWPVSLVEKIYKASPPGSPIPYYTLRRLEPVADEVLYLKPKTPAEVSALPGSDPESPPFEPHISLHGVDAMGNVNRTVKTPLDPMRHMVHRGHLLSLPDNWGGPMRSILPWWLLATMDRDWWARYLELYGTPFIVAKADSQSISDLQTAFSMASRLHNLVVDHQTEVDLKEASTNSTGTSYQEFLAVCHREQSKLILGQTLSAEAQSTGLQSSVGNLHGEVRQDVRMFDSLRLAATIERQLFAPFLAINNLKGQPPKITWGRISSAELSAQMAVFAQLRAAGMEPEDDAFPIISDLLGYGVRRASLAPVGVAGPFGLSAQPQAPLWLFKAYSRTDHPAESVVTKYMDELAAAYKGNLAPIRQLILGSKSALDLRQKLASHYSDWKPSRVDDVLEEAMQLAAASVREA